MMIDYRFTVPLLTTDKIPDVKTMEFRDRLV
jgi:hypothetical protein